jgi:hypothetical protein
MRLASVLMSVLLAESDTAQRTVRPTTAAMAP